MDALTHNALLLHQADLFNSHKLYPTWFTKAYDRFRVIMTDEEHPHPCYFGVDGEKTGMNFYTYVDESSIGASLAQLPYTLQQFLYLAATLPRKRTSFLAFFGPPEENASLTYYTQQFWRTLFFLHEKDSHPWPASVPYDPENAKWEFCFAGEPLFVFGSCPAYKLRRSRNMGKCLVILFQSKRVFDGIGGETRAGRTAKLHIRQRLQTYDSIPPHSTLGPYEHSSASKWRQYFLPDDDMEISGECPFVDFYHNRGDYLVEMPPEKGGAH